jgi:hypothetical protein
MIIQAIPIGRYDEYGKYVGGYHYEMKCDVCGKTYISPTKLKKKYCSDICAAKGNSRVKYAKKKAKREESREDKKCPCCDKVFSPKRTDSVFCSIACKQAAYRERKKNSQNSNEV